MLSKIGIKMANTTMNRINLVAKSLVLLVLLFFCYQMFTITIPYLLPPFPTDIDFLLTKQNILHLDWWRWAFYVHISTSFFVLLSGATQFSKYILKQFPKIHRNIGKLYVILILGLSAPSGLIMAYYANAGLPAQIGFISLSVLWWIFTFLAYRYATQGKLMLHGKWIIRSYALTLSAISLRAWTFLFGYLMVPLDYVTAYIIVAWLSWTLNLLIAEGLIKAGLVQYYFSRK